MPIYNALIRTHHIVSRVKINKLKEVAKRFDCYALLRTGGVPGVMYVEAQNPHNVLRWTEAVRELRYKHYDLRAPVAVSELELSQVGPLGKLEQVYSLKEMVEKMEERELTDWWRKAMGFVAE